MCETVSCFTFLKLPKHQWWMRSLLCIRPYSKHTRTHTQMFALAKNHTHNYLYTQICSGTFAHMCTVGVYTHTLTRTHSMSESQGGRSQRRSRYCQMVRAMCVMTALVFLICDVAFCVYFFAYACGRLILPYFSVIFFLFFITVAIRWIFKQQT